MTPSPYRPRQTQSTTLYVHPPNPRRVKAETAMTSSGAEKRGEPHLRLTLRDLQLLETLHTARYLTTAQIQRLFWRESRGGLYGQTKACQQRLRKLWQQGLVRRIELPVKRGEGTKPYIYALDRKGAALLVSELGIEPQSVEWRPRSQEEHYPFLAHLLATTDFRIALSEACAQTGVELQEWLDEKELKRAQQMDRVELVSPQGSVLQTAVVPDAYFLLCREGKCGLFFLEVDLGTVTLAPSKWERRGWMRKIRAYAAYFASEAFYRRYQGRRARILTVTPSALRLQHLKRTTEAVFAELRKTGEDASAEDSFWFGLLTLDLSEPDVLTAQRWSVAGSDAQRALLE